MILAGDIGGTNTRLALFDDRGTLTHLRAYPSQTHPDLTAIIRLYQSEVAPGERIDRACFGVAGPVRGEPGRLASRITNLTWTIEQVRLAEALGLPPARVRLINDLAANAAGIDAVGGDTLVTLQAGTEQPGGRGIVSAGTGLGVGGSVWDGHQHIPCPSEGGHYSFGPRNDLEYDLLRFLAGREAEAFRGYVSWERVLSGPGCGTCSSSTSPGTSAPKPCKSRPAPRPEPGRGWSPRPAWPARATGRPRRSTCSSRCTGRRPATSRSSTPRSTACSSAAGSPRRSSRS
jgi:glucokinase